MKYGIEINLITIDDESKEKTTVGCLSVVFVTEEQLWDAYHRIAATVAPRGEHDIVDPAMTEPFRCPDCQNDKFIEGPHGGLSINFCCAACGARFNDAIAWIDRMPADGDERMWFNREGGWYRPRCAEIRKDFRLPDDVPGAAIGREIFDGYMEDAKTDSEENP